MRRRRRRAARRRRRAGIPAISTPTAIGAVSATWSLTVRAVTWPRPKNPSPPPVLELAVSVGPKAPIAAVTTRPRIDADEPAEDALGERLAHHLAHDEPLRPAERLERAELAHALPDRRERQEHGQQERGDRGEHGERRPEPLGEARGIDERAADRVGDLLGARDLRPRVERLDLLLHVADRCPVLGPDEEDVDGALLAREHLELRQGDVDVGRLAAERRPHEADDGERGAVEVELRADLQVLAARVGAREQRLVGAARPCSRR